MSTDTAADDAPVLFEERTASNGTRIGIATRAAELGSEGLPRTLATTIGVVGTDAALSKAQASRLAMSGHDGMARAVVPAHTMFDGDTLFTLATGEREAPDAWAMHQLLQGAADVVARAMVRATLAAPTVTTSAGTWRGYVDAFPSAVW